MEFDQEALSELLTVPAFHHRRIMGAIRDLHHQAETETRNRKPLATPLDLLPEATWELRVDPYRVLYFVAARTVRVLRVIMKVGTTEDSL